MNKRMVPLDLVLGILKDHPHAASKIERAFPKFGPIEPKVEASLEMSGDVVLKMPKGVAHSLHDAVRDVLTKWKCGPTENHETLEAVQEATARVLGLFGT